MIDHIYNSTKSQRPVEFQLAGGHISTTTILFEGENILVRIEAKGELVFLNRAEKPLTTLRLPPQTGGRQQYLSVQCAVEKGAPVLKFPIVRWIDHYPYCDGEHDRWDAQTIGYHTVTFDRQTNTASLD